jgi:hypothetical protein
MPGSSRSSPGMTSVCLHRHLDSRYDFAISRRDAPEVCIYLSPPFEGVGNAGCPLHPQPPVQKKSTGVEATGTPESPGIPARNGFNGFLRALPGDRACLPPSFRGYRVPNPVGPTCLRELDASVGASGPHDFAVRGKHLSSACSVIAHGFKNPPCHHLARKTLPRPPHPTPRP